MKPFVFLYGPPGVGKSTLGKMLADDLSLPQFDLDEKIEESAGHSIPTIFGSQGTGRFREMESAALKSILEDEPGVVALGGGALLDPSNRSLTEAHGKIVCLTAPLDVLQTRLENDQNERPLLQENALPDLLDQRKDHYDSFPLRLDAGSFAVDQALWEIKKLVGMFRVTGMGAGYDLRVEPGGLNHAGELIEMNQLSPPFALISDDNVGSLYVQTVLDGLKCDHDQAWKIIFPAGETHKTMEATVRLWDELVHAGMERGGTVIALGGGVVNDLAGFVAATYMRGVSWVALPTSLLAMVDASLGGKTGANLASGKNLVGAFHPPRFVFADPQTLATLPEAEITSGLAEVVKHAIIGDPALYSLCGQGLDAIRADWATLIGRAMGVKVRIIQEDPFETGGRAALNFGHTIGHGIEQLSGYSIRHGEAVAIGMVAEARLAEMLQIAHAGLVEELQEVLPTLNLPVGIPPDIDRKSLFEAMQVDKKRAAGSLRFALPAAVGEVRTGIEIKDLAKLIKKL